MSSAGRGTKRLVALGSALTVSALALAVVGTATALHGPGALEVHPETTARTVGSEQTLTATLTAPAATNVTIHFENEGGVNDPDTPPSVTRRAPDALCTIAAGGSSCTFAYRGTRTGRDSWRVWVDEDQVVATFNGDAGEARDEQARAGSGDACAQSEPDCTDVVAVTWTGGAPQTLDCDDRGGPDSERETNPSRGGRASVETYRCIARDEFRNRTGDSNPTTPGRQPFLVKGEVENAINDPDPVDGASYDTPDYACRISSGGTCRIAVQQSEREVGTARICFWIGNVLCEAEATGERADAGDLADRLEKTWRDPRTSRVRSRVTARHQLSPHAFGGRVLSTEARCVSGRSVRVRERQPGLDPVAGAATSGRGGTWSVAHVAGGRGRYYAEVTRRIIRNANRLRDTIVCGEARSGTLTVGR